MRVRFALLYAGLFGTLPVLPASAQIYPVASVLRAEMLRLGAMMGGDTLTLRQFLGEELVYTHSNGMVETKALQLIAVGSGRTVYQSIAPDSMGYHIYGDVAVGAGSFKSKGTLDGVAFDVVLRVATVHVMREGHWQLVLWQSTRVP